MSCLHIETLALQPPSDTQAVYREDCTQCFDSIDDSDGLDVCLSCFNGGCAGERNHARLHAITKNHPLVLNIRRTRRILQHEEPPRKISKIAIAPVTEAELYDYQTKVKCLHCNIHSIDKSVGGLAEMINCIMKANTYSRKEEVKAWEQIYTSCEHILCLNQEPSRQIESQKLGHCSLCDLRENLWLCLECGNLGCGRAQFGGLQGNSHGLEHKNKSGHAVAVKLGSITPEGTADVYCYACDEERIDDNLSAHLKHWGIILAERQKTEKSLTEMQIDENSRWEFSMTDNDGHELKRLFGSGFTGLKNLGNSCYLASALQCLFALPKFQERYNHSGDLPIVDDPAQDLETQLRKLGDGLLSGRYSRKSDQSSNENESPRGLEPSMLKALIGKDHPEFSTMRQQDAFEFLLHVFKLISRSKHVAPLQDPTQTFRFVLEQRLQCTSCKKVRYRSDEQDNISILVPVRKLSNSKENLNISENKPDEYEAISLKECLDNFTSDELVELTCSSCGSKDGFLKRSLFKTFPEILIVNARRFVIINWVPTKVDVPVYVDDGLFNMDAYMSPGHQSWEELFLDDEEENSKPEFVPNEAALQQIEMMGFTRNQCVRALHATGNADVGSAMDWLFSHLEDPDVDTPLQMPSGTKAESGPASSTVNNDDPEKIEMLQAMGFSIPGARKALKETGGDMERAVEWLFNHPNDQDESNEVEEDFPPETGGEKPKEIPGSNNIPMNFQLSSIICHKGASIHSGHYVAFVRKKIPENDMLTWVLYNDEKVVQANDIEEMKKFAYVYLFQRI